MGRISRNRCSSCSKGNPDPERTDDVVIHSYHEVRVPFQWDKNADGRELDISKDRLVDAKLDVEIEGWPGWLDVITTEYVVNGNLMVHFKFPYKEYGTTKSKLGIDVKAFLRHGRNNFTAWVYKTLLGPEGSANFTATLHLHYVWEEGETPPEEPGPTEPAPPKGEKEWWEKLIDYLPIIIVGGVIVYVLSWLPRPRR